MAKETENRKLEHIKICLNQNVEFKTKSAGFQDIELIHQSLPELDYQAIDLTTHLFERKFDYPILINAMTGGHPESIKINKTLAQIASEFNIPMEVGSQRAAIENEKLISTYRIAREASQSAAGEIFLIGNIGGGQLVKGYGIREINKSIEMIDADALAIHLNPLQEVLQKEGDINYQKLLGKIREVIKQVKIPIIVKETGNGLSREALGALKDIGVKYVDVSGAGGTSWAAVESYRHKDISEFARIANNFRDWGIPTVVSTLTAVKMGFNVISSGGIRTGIDIAKAIACGADMAGIALPFLANAYREDLNALRRQMQILIRELKICMFLTKSFNLEELKSAEKIFLGKTKQWIEAINK
ncbi:MAG: type 2 isopentenyl-diphosphate Delta-isomerase [Candidatus Helarchaeota archaeon]|nr:type 2 isopentenyl-diphosphate Delta-isomerase [Candidatus Helarchaeota archaeon]